MDTYDAVIVGAGLAGLAAAKELTDAGRRVLLLDQEPPQSLGGQAFWSFGGLFLVDSPEQRRMGITDSHELAHQDWMGTAGFDRIDDEDAWAVRWAEAYLDFAGGEKRAWLAGLGVSFFPIVGWAERGGHLATGPGNSVPRFHITWGTGPGLLAPFADAAKEAERRGLLTFGFRHRVDELVVEDGRVVGARGGVLEPSGVARGEQSSREVVGDFDVRGAAVIVTSGGIGGDLDLVRASWPARLGTAPQRMIAGVPHHVDGRMLRITERAGGRIVNGDRMWHYVEGVQNFAPIWPKHGIRVLPGPSSIWLDATGARLPVPNFPGFDTLGALEHIMKTGHDHTWFVLNQAIIEREFALSGSEQNPDLTNRDLTQLSRRLLPGAPGPVEAFKDKGVDFVVDTDLDQLLRRMRALVPDAPFDVDLARREVLARDREMANPFTKDLQVASIHAARNYRGDRLIRVAKPNAITDPADGPLIAVRLNLLTRKTLGGLQTNLSSQVMGGDGVPVAGLYAAGEVAGFGGGGYHGYRSLEGTFLGGCLFSGRAAGRHAATVG